MRLWTKTTWVPIDRCVNKALQPVKESAEYSAALRLMGDDIYSTYAYREARTGRVDWGQVMFGKHVPGSFKYWCSPWSSKPRPPMTEQEIALRTLRFPELLANFRHILLSSKDGWIGSPVDAIQLIDEMRSIYLYLDGNHRIAAMLAWGHHVVPVRIRGRFTRVASYRWVSDFECHNYQLYMHRQDVDLWWDTAWRSFNA